MPQVRFDELLATATLYFANASCLTDRYEVTVPNDVLERKRLDLIQSGVTGLALHNALRQWEWTNDPDKALTLVNCWSTRPDESYALWKIYLADRTKFANAPAPCETGGSYLNGVAIRCTVSHLRESIARATNPGSEQWSIATVNYAMTLPDNFTRYHAVCTKKPYYDFEREVRAFILYHGTPASHPEISRGRFVNVHLPSLLQEVYLSPWADPQSYSYLEGRLNAVAPRAVLRQSRLRDQ